MSDLLHGLLVCVGDTFQFLSSILSKMIPENGREKVQMDRCPNLSTGTNICKSTFGNQTDCSLCKLLGTTAAYFQLLSMVRLAKRLFPPICAIGGTLDKMIKSQTSQSQFVSCLHIYPNKWAWLLVKSSGWSQFPRGAQPAHGIGVACSTRDSDQ